MKPAKSNKKPTASAAISPSCSALLFSASLKTDAVVASVELKVVNVEIVNVEIFSIVVETVTSGSVVSGATNVLGPGQGRTNGTHLQFAEFGASGHVKQFVSIAS